MKNYKFDFNTQTLTITKDFEKKMMNPTSTEYQIYIQLRKDFPNFQMKERTTNRKKPNPYKGLTFSKMENYINLHENAEELLTLFNAVKEIGKCQNNTMKYVADWFIAQFPNYKEMPLFNKNGKILYVAPLKPEEKGSNVSEFTKTA